MGILQRTCLTSYRQVRLCTTTSQTTLKFESYIRERRRQADKSLLIQVSDIDSAPELQDYLTTTFGPLENIFHYSLPSVTKRVASNVPTGKCSHWIIAEFTNQEDTEKALHSSKFQEGTVPYASSMCWFSQNLKAGEKKGSATKRNTVPSVPSEVLGKAPDKVDYSNAPDLSSQIKAYEDAYKLTEIAIRARFVICKSLEQSVTTLFPRGCVLPFGSTANGLGQTSGDLDIVLLAEKTEFFHESTKNDNSRLWYQSKMFAPGGSFNARFQSQRVMETIADILTLFVPGCSSVLRILNARVPILRFNSDFTNLQCDLSMINASGVFMSELIYTMKAIDPRFSSLLFVIRAWAAENNVVKNVTRKPTNFMMVLLLVHYLQVKRILPSLDVLFNNADKDDVRATSDGIDCTFLRDPSKVRKFFTAENQNSDLGQLMTGFFQYYSSFNFERRGITLFTTAGLLAKPEASPFYLQNPLERHLNVARNVSAEGIQNFKIECSLSLRRLDEGRATADHGRLLKALLAPVKKEQESTKRKKFSVKELLQDS